MDNKEKISFDEVVKKTKEIEISVTMWTCLLIMTDSLLGKEGLEKKYKHKFQLQKALAELEESKKSLELALERTEKMISEK